MPMVERLFADCALRPQDCDAFAFANGPGSFTGLRVACTLVQGLALGSGRPVVEVGHLDALLRAALEAGGQDSPAGTRVATLLDARMQQAYWCVHEQGPDGWRCVEAPAVGGIAELSAALERWQPARCAGDLPWLRGYIGGLGFALQEASVDAAVVARMALEKLARGLVVAPEAAAPVYVRERVALTVQERARRRADAAGA